MSTVLVLVVCCNPACSGRSVEGETVNREAWNATWLGADWTALPPCLGEWASDIVCPSCGTEGIDPESDQLDSAEEELGARCPECGVVWAPLRNRTEGAPNGYCPNDGTELPA